MRLWIMRERGMAGLVLALVMSLAGIAAAQPQTQPGPGEGEGDATAEPLVVRGSADYPWFLRAERTEDGQWFVLLDTGTTLETVLTDTRLPNRLYATTHERDPETRRALSIRINQLNGLFLEQAGLLQQGDVIHTLNGEPVTRVTDLVNFARLHPDAHRLEAVVSTDGERRTLVATLFRQPLRNGLSHRLADGETLESVAEEYYGDPRFYRLLVRANDLRNGEASAGARVKIPHHPALRYPAEQLADNVWLIPHTEHVPAIEGFAGLLRQVRPLPARLPDGRRGLRLAGPNRRALPFQRGLQRGDIVLSVNGVSMERGADVLGFYNTHRHLMFFEVVVWRDDAELRLQYCLLPAPDVSPEALQPPPTAAQPAEFGCEPDADAASALATAEGLEASQVIAWRVTRAQTRFLSHHYREILRDAHLMPVLDTPPGSRDGAFSGLRIRYADEDTLIHSYGFRPGDVLQAVRIDDGDWQPVRATFELVRLFPIGLDATTVDLRLVRGGRPLLIRATLVPTPEGIDELPLRTRYGADANTGGEANDDDEDGDDESDGNE